MINRIPAINQPFLLLCAFAIGAAYSLYFPRKTRKERQLEQTVLSLEIELRTISNNRYALKEMCNVYRENLEIFQGIRSQVEIGLRDKIDSLKDQLDIIEHELLDSQQSQEDQRDEADEDDDDAWLMENVVDVPFTPRPDIIYEYSDNEDIDDLLLEQDDFPALVHQHVTHHLVNNLSPDVFIADIDILFSQYEPTDRESLLAPLFMALLLFVTRNGSTLKSAIKFWERYRIVLHYYIEDSQDTDILIRIMDVLLKIQLN